MGIKTRDELVSFVLQTAGDVTQLGNAQQQLNTTLRKLYESARWSFLQKRLGEYSMALGAQDFALTVASIPSLPHVFKVRKLWVRVQGTTLKLLPSEGNASVPTFAEEDTSTRRATPSSFSVISANNSPYEWTLRLDAPLPAAAKLLVDVQITPAALSAGGDKPPYPNDETIEASMLSWAWKNQNEHGKAESEWGRFIQLKREDMVKYIRQTDDEGTLKLDPRRFRPEALKRYTW